MSEKTMSPEAAERKAQQLRERKKAKLAQVLGRGLVNHRLEVKDGDPDRFYAWVREREEDVAKYQALGYRVETEAGEGQHEAGDDRRRVGDCILMSIDRESYEIIREIHQEKTAQKLTAGKREYIERARSHGVPIITGEEE